MFLNRPTYSCAGDSLQISMDKFQIAVLTPAGFIDPSLAISASRAGVLGILNLEYTANKKKMLTAVNKLAQYARGEFGIKLDWQNRKFFLESPLNLFKHLKIVILTCDHTENLKNDVQNFQQKGLAVVLECISLEQARLGNRAGVDGIIAKGNETGGHVGDETTYILLQKLLQSFSLPIWAQGGIGLHTAAACYGGGAAGIILDSQLSLTRESPFSKRTKAIISRMDGSETVCLGDEIGKNYRLCSRLGAAGVKELRRKEKFLADSDLPQGEIVETWQKEVFRLVSRDSSQGCLYLLGQDICLASFFCERFVTVSGVISAIRDSVVSHCSTASSSPPFGEGSPLAKSHGTLYPIVQGPMAQVSDNVAFAGKVASEGALPFIAVSWMEGKDLDILLQQTRDHIKNHPWGVGLLGFLPSDIYNEQIDIIKSHSPSFALIAGGRADQAIALEKQGISTYLHVPSPGLLKLFIKSGVRRFIFEGRECGGHVGPRSGFVLWETMINILLELIPLGHGGEAYHLLFAGGIHDAVSAAMVGLMTAPLTNRGVRVGVQLGSSYLFTREAVSTGAILRKYQQELIGCDGTVVLESGPGHAIRCVQTPYVNFFRNEQQKLILEGKSADAIREALEELGRGRLRVASKGEEINPEHGKKDHVALFLNVPEMRQHSNGIYMTGQLAALHHRDFTIKRLHRNISLGSTEIIKSLGEKIIKPAVNKEEKPSDIAIIGMGCILPKAPELSAYWENILNKVSAIREVPKERWDWKLYYDKNPDERDRVYSRWGGFIDDIPFDPLKYGFPPKTLSSIEPLQLLTLEAVSEALKDAGYSTRPFARERTSVILGISGTAELGQKYSIRSSLPMLFGESEKDIITGLDGNLPEWTEDSFPGILMNVTAGRISNRFNLGGTNFTVDAACASSLAALHLAVKELESGSSDMVITGGADAMQNPFTYLCFSKTKALSPTGQSAPLDENADGIVIGEGVAVMILKRLEDAERDGDRIYAVIKGIGAGSDGRDKSLTAPSRDGQIRTLKRAYDKAKISPSTVEFVEGHATGTPVGDSVELEALNRFLCDAGSTPKSCGIGSVKSMIGHTKSTAGTAGLIKTALSLYHKVLPPTLGVEKPNNEVDASDSPLYVNTETRPWICSFNEHPRRAGVSAFGFGGTNFHVVLEEYTDGFMPLASRTVSHKWPMELFILSGDSRKEIMESIKSLEDALSKRMDHSIGDLAYTINQQYLSGFSEKEDSKLKLSLVAGSRDDLRQKLVRAGELLAGSDMVINDPRGIYFSEKPFARSGGIAFLFPGQGSQYVGMLSDLAVAFPEIRKIFERSDCILNGKFSRPLSSFIFPPPAFAKEKKDSQKSALAETKITQPAMGTASLALFHLLKDLGVQPDMVAGHSYGEYSALCAAGVFSEEELIVLSEARGRFITEEANSDSGTMAAISASHDDVAKVIDHMDNIWIANLNAPGQTIIAGTKQVLELVLEKFRDLRIPARLIPVSGAFHSPLVSGACDRLKAFLTGIDMKEPSITVFSNTTASVFPDDSNAIAELLGRHLSSPVEFIREILAMYDTGARIFIEVGPGRVLSGLTDQILNDRPHLTVASDQAGRNSLVQLTHLLAELAANGVQFQMEKLYKGRSLKNFNLKRLNNKFLYGDLPPTTWLVNGARAMPLKEAGMEQPVKPITLSIGGKMSSIKDVKEVKPVSNATLSLSRAGVSETMIRHQKLMNHFLETQKNVMLSYFQVSPSQNENLSASFKKIEERSDIDPPDPEPIEKIELGSGVDSAREETNSLHYGLESHLLRIVSDRTGYPEEMLDFDLDMEADLGIDSIKRGEIAGVFRGETCPAHGKKMGKEMEDLAGIRTLRGIIEWAKEMIGAHVQNEDPVITPEPKAGELITGEKDGTPAKNNSVRRFTVSAVAAPLEGPPASLPDHGVMLVTDDERGIAQALVKSLTEAGQSAVLVRLSDKKNVTASDCLMISIDSQEDATRFLEKVNREYGPVSGLVHLLPLKESRPFNSMDLVAFKHRFKLEFKSLFYLIKALEKDFGQAAQKGGALLIGVTAMEENFADRNFEKKETFFPGHGAIAGLLKSLALEWPDVRIKTVDLKPDENVSELAKYLMNEIGSEDQLVEVGYNGSNRFTLKPRIAFLDPERERMNHMDSSWVILITGGAKGITADVAFELSKLYKPIIILTGRSDPPPAQEDTETAGLHTLKEIKGALISRMKREGQSFKPAHVEPAYNRLLGEREIRRNINAMQTAGAVVHYYPADAREEDSFGKLIDHIYAEHGRIDGVIHGAGIIEDKLMRDKTEASFDRVFNTKVDSGFILSRRLDPGSLKFLIFFASVAGKFGNIGQGDYAAANEVLNKLAVYLDGLWPARVAAVNWGPWAKSGMVTPELERQFEQRGVELVPPDVGVHMLDQEICFGAKGESEVILGGIGWT
ncbi:type I polyketide synthase [Desulfobacula sp.]|uniref:type I polyketide synthase n=1 Tax=Desulfobacula sp. TaxID=2593537 RepID=UPI002607D21C|nr:type I polyketide synthase [Desulfobacula sp.]